MPNAITKFSKFIDRLDEVYKLASCTSVLDSDSTLVRAGANANELIIPKLTMDGLADYSRSSGYVDGDTNFTNETVTFNYDRGRRFSVDNMDNEETAGLAFGRLAAEFVRTKTVPELDAFRFATYAAQKDIFVKTGSLTGGNDVISALIAAQSEMDEAEVATESRVLFITPTLLNAANNVDTTKSKAVLDSFSKVVKVPQSRFYTAIDMADGKSDGEKAGGYKKAAAKYEVTASQPDDWTSNYSNYYTVSDGVYTPVASTASWEAGKYYRKVSEEGKPINFMVIEKSAVIQYPKHTVNKVITPEENQSSDSWLFFFRAYGLADVFENKRSGIYLHYAG
jgi:hypothetical protein